MGYTSRLTINSRVLELFVVASVIILMISLSFILLGGTLAEARDSQRVGDVATLRRALELYYLDHGSYPDTSWVNSGDDSWNELAQMLAPYLGGEVYDPINDTDGRVEETGAYNYAYQGVRDSVTGKVRDYVIVFRLERPERVSFRQRVTQEIKTEDGEVNLEELTGTSSVFAMTAPS